MFTRNVFRTVLEPYFSCQQAPQALFFFATSGIRTTGEQRHILSGKERTMPHPSTLVLCALLVTKTVCFAFVGVAPSVGLGGKILTLPRSASGAAPISQTAERRVRRTTHELQQQQQHQYRDLGGRHGSRGDMRRGRGILATADDDEDGEEVLPARCAQLIQ